MNTRMKRILSAILVLAMLTAGMPALASEPAVGGEQEQNVPGSGPDTILLADEGGESMDGDPDEGAPADGEPADGEPAADEPADGEPAGGAAAMPTPAPGNPSIADAGDDDVFVPQGTEPPVMKTTSPQSNISTIPDFMGDDDVFVPQGMEPTFMKAASPQNNTRAIPAFTIPPGVSPPTLPPFIYPVLVVWQNVDIPRTYGEEGYDTLPTAGFIFRDMMPGVSQTPIHLDIEITDPDGNVVTEITKVGTYTATIISDDPPGCKIAYYFSNCGPKSVTFEVKNEYQIIWSNLERAFGSQGWRTPPVAKCTIRGVTYEFPMKMYNYYGEEITSATFDNLMYDFKGPNSNYNCTAVAQMDQMADVIPNFSDYQFLDTSTKFKFNPLGFNVLVKEAVRSGSSTATITAVYGDPVVLTGEVSHLQYENVEPHILEMINEAAPTMYYVNPRKSFPYAVGTHTDGWIILGCNVDGINSSNINPGVEYDHRNGYILQIVHKIVEPDWANIADRTWGEVGWDAMPIATFTDINGVAQPLTLTLKKRGNNGFAPVSSVDGTGEYSVTVSMPDNNYALKNPDGDDAIDNITKTFVVSPAEIEITWTDANDRTFGLTGWDALPTAKYIMAGTEYTPDVKVTKGNTTVTALDPTASVTGEYKAVAQVEDTVNYTFTKGKETTFNIDQLAVQITSEQFVPGADGAVLAKLYGEDEPEYGIGYTLVNGGALAEGMDALLQAAMANVPGREAGEDAGRYPIAYTADQGVLQNIDFRTPDIAWVLEILPLPVDVNWKNVIDRVYDEENWDALPTAGHDTVFDDVADLTVALYKLEGEGETPVTAIDGAGAYKATAITNNNNYALNGADENGVVSTSFSILPREVKAEDVVWSNVEDRIVTYTGWDTMPTAVAKIGESEVNLTIALTKDGEQVTAITGPGTYTATVIAADYAVIGEASETFTVEKLKLYMVVNNKSGKRFGHADKPSSFGVYNPVVDQNGNSFYLENIDALFNYVIGIREPGEAIGEYAITGFSTAGIPADMPGATWYEFYPSQTGRNGKFIISHAPVTVSIGKEGKVYGESDPDLHALLNIQCTCGAADCDFNAANVMDIIRTDLAFTRAAGENVGTYAYTFADNSDSLEATFDNAANYTVALADGVTFEIEKLAVTVTPDAGQSKIYGAKDPETFAYSVTFDADATELTADEIEAELGDNILVRAEGEDVATYAFTLADTFAPANYDVSFTDDVTFAIEKLPVTITPDANQSKIYGANDPETFAYSVTFDTTATELTAEAIQAELGDDILVRADGEAVGTYAIGLADGFNPANYAVTLTENVIFTINAPESTVISAVDSRIAEFTVTIALPEDVDAAFVEALALTAAFDLSGCENLAVPAEDALKPEFANVNGTYDGDGVWRFAIPAYAYAAEEQAWTGFLPAGAKIAIDVKDANGADMLVEVEGATVSAAALALNMAAAGGAYPLADGVAMNANGTIEITYTGNKLEGEIVKITLEENTVYATFGEDGKIILTKDDMLSALDASSTLPTADLLKEIKAEFLDSANLDTAVKTGQYVYDIGTEPAKSATFATRSELISFVLGEAAGSAPVVTVDGIAVNVPLGDSAEYTDVTFTEWMSQPEALFTIDSIITIAYQDQAGNESVSADFTVANKSTAQQNTSIYVRPEAINNTISREGGKELRLSGRGVAYEKITVTVAGRKYNLTVSAGDGAYQHTATGNWGLSLDLEKMNLPANKPIYITVSYQDMDEGTSRRTLIYKDWTMPVLINAPIAQDFTQIYGFAEPGSTITIMVNGQTYSSTDADGPLKIGEDGYYTLTLPTAMITDDVIILQHKDFVGNLSDAVSIVVMNMYDGNTIAQPMGKNIFGHFEDEEGNLTGAHRYVTPFNVDEMRAAIAAGTPEATAFDVPLLAYAGYQVGTMTFRYDAENNQLIMTPAIDESFRVEGAQPRMTVYTECPTIEELVRATHENASFDPIPLANVSGTLYIYAEFDVHVDQETITGSEGFITFTPDALEAMGGTIGTLYTKFQNQ